MSILEPSNQKKIFVLNNYLLDLIRLYKSKILPNKILLSGQKGIGKSTLAYHFINYVLSEDSEYKYDLENFEINVKSRTFKTIQNKSNPNLIIIDIISEKKTIEINQIRDLIINLNKSSFNDKPRFVLIDNIELLNISSVNALLKILEEPNKNIYFILINSNKKIAKTLLSRCINFKINITNKDCLEVSNKLLNGNLDAYVNKDLVNYYFSPGTIYNLVKFANNYKYDLKEHDLQSFLRLLISEKLYKKDLFMKNMIFYFLESYFQKINLTFTLKINEKYSYFLKRISDTRNFNLDEESLFMEFEEEVLNG